MFYTKTSFCGRYSGEEKIIKDFLIAKCSNILSNMKQRLEVLSCVPELYTIICFEIFLPLSIPACLFEHICDVSKVLEQHGHIQ